MDKGLARLTAREIASAAQVSSSTFYQHFENVDAALAAGAEFARTTALSSADSDLSQAIDGPKTAVIASLVTFASKKPALAHALGPELGMAIPAVADCRGRLVDMIAPRLLPQGKSGDALRARLAGAGLWATLAAARDPEGVAKAGQELDIVLARLRDISSGDEDRA